MVSFLQMPKTWREPQGAGVELRVAPGCTNKAFLYEIEIVLHSIRQKKSSRGEGCVQGGAPTPVSTLGPAHLTQPHVRGPCCLNAMHCCKQAWVSWALPVSVFGKKGPQS